jgi:hypothetical protein
MLAMHVTVERRPSCVADLLGLDYLPPGLSHLADGNQSSVYRKGDTVLKVHVPSITMSDQERKDLVSIETNRHNMLIQHLQDLALPQQMFIGKHPILRGESAVQITQPYVTGFDPQLFTEAQVQINTHRVADLEQRSPHALAQLSTLATRSLHMYQETGLLVDTNGARNIIIQADESCLLIDSTPIGPDHADIQNLILEQTLQLAEL